MLIALDERYREASVGRFAGHQVIFFNANTTDVASFLDQIRSAEVLGCSRAGPFPFGRALIEALPRLQFIQKSGAGDDWFDVSALNDHGILLALNTGFNASSVADHILMLTLLCMRGALQPMISLRNGVWQREATPPSLQLEGKTVGIIGVGHIGAHVARRVTGFGAQVIAYQRHPRPELAILGRIRWVSLDELLRESDVVVLCVPLTPETRRLIGPRELAMMKPTAVLINCARGAVVDERALYEALANRRIWAAGLDVFEHEPTPADNPLLQLDNVVATPHIAGSSRESEKLQVAGTLENIERFLAGQRPLRLVNPDLLERGTARAKHLQHVVGAAGRRPG